MYLAKWYSYMIRYLTHLTLDIDIMWLKILIYIYKFSVWCFGEKAFNGVERIIERIAYR